MEHLFSTDLNIDGRDIRYNVMFENEQYVFRPDNDQEHPSFSLKREADSWQGMETLDPSLRQIAITSLEAYLLAQH